MGRHGGGPIRERSGKPVDRGSADAGQPAALGAGQVGGRVVDARSKKSVAGAEVSVTFTPPAGGEIRKGKSEGSGTFRVADVAPGAPFTLEVRAEGYRSAQRENQVVPEGGGLSLGTIALDPVPLVQGTVVDGKGKPVAGATVSLTGETGLKFGPDTNIADFMKNIAVAEKSLGETKSDEEGVFAFYPGDAEEGEYCLRASAPGFATGMAHVVRVKKGVEARPMKVVLEAPVELSGKVVDLSRGPVAGATVVVLWGNEREAVELGRFVFDKYWTTSGKDGTFRFTDLQKRKPNEYMLVARKEGLSTTMKEVHVPSKEEVVIELQEGFVIEGRVVDDATGKEIAGAKVLAMGRRERGFGQGETDEAGRFRIENLNPGKYEMMVSAKGYTPNEVRFEGMPGEILEKEIRLKAGVELTGKVIDADSRKPLAGATVLTVAQGDEAMFGGGSVKTVSGPEGSFHIEKAPVFDIGGWSRELRERIRKKGVVLGAFKEGWLMGEPVKVEVAEGEDRVRGIELLMQRAPLASGKVVDGKGAPIANAEIRAIDSKRTMELAMMLGKTPKKVFSDAEGKFSIPLGLGENVFLVVHHSGFALGWRAFERIEPGAEMKGVDIRLTPGGAIEGVVLDENGNPLAREAVRYRFCGEGSKGGIVSYHPSLQSFRQKVVTGEDGSFVIRRLRPGPWEVSVNRDRSSGQESRRVEV
ncbi:MAG: carboxypeptidase regulatory-like domain-containing protein, partial [Planctomycetota bacterium]